MQPINPYKQYFLWSLSFLFPTAKVRFYHFTFIYAKIHIFNHKHMFSNYKRFSPLITTHNDSTVILFHYFPMIYSLILFFLLFFNIKTIQICVFYPLQYVYVTNKYVPDIYIDNFSLCFFFRFCCIVVHLFYLMVNIYIHLYYY